MDLDRVSPTRKLAISGMVMALYIVVMCLTQSFSFGQYQVRIATSIYATAYLCPFLTVPLALSNLLANMLMGGLGIYDIVGGGLVGLLTAGGCALLRRFRLTPWLTAVPIAIVPAFVVPIWLHTIISVPYLALVSSLLVGQVIAGVCGAVLLNALITAFGAMKKGAKA